ncbi:MAG: TonB family protein [Ignavibacteriales bacterium]|nr:TonB family protein [Ignavibacteriales bacterium]
MKKIIFLFMILFTISCNNQKDEIEIIPDYDKIFLNSDQVDKKIDAENVGINIDEMQKLFDFKSLFDSLKQGNHKCIYNLLVNENGKVGFIRIINSINQNFDKSLVQLTKKWKFIPAEKNSQKVKSQINLITILNFDYKGDYKLELFFGYEHYSSLNLISANYIEEYLEAVEEMPEPIGGIQAIQQKIKYPESAKKAGIEGRVYVKTFIDETGNVSSAEIIKGTEESLNNAALEAVKATKFTPGRQRGVPVKVQVAVPILFKLSNEEVKK